MTQHEPTPVRPAISQRFILFAGFGTLLLLMGLVVYHANRTLTQIETTNAKIRQEMARRDDLLDRLRSDLLRFSIEVRDYLLDFNPSLEETQRAELEARRDEITNTLQEYEKNLESVETTSARALDTELAEYWQTLSPVLQWPAEYRRTYGDTFLREQLFPRRQNLLQLVDQIAAIDSKQLTAGEESIATVHQQLRRDLTESSFLIIGIGLMVGLFSIRQIDRLEKISARQYQEVVKARGELRKLNARLVAVEEDERRKISRELHDQVGQHLSAVLIELGNVDSGLPQKEPELHRRIESARRLAEASIAKVRDLALLLRPSMLDDLGLVSALRWQAREMTRRTGVEVEIAAAGISEDIPSECQTCIFRVAQEAMNNAVCHAKPSSVRVTLRQRSEEIHVVIQDDGVGFDPDQDKGMGTLGMKERIQGLGGILQIDSYPGGGTIVSVLLPLKQLVGSEA